MGKIIVHPRNLLHRHHMRGEVFRLTFLLEDLQAKQNQNPNLYPYDYCDLVGNCRCKYDIVDSGSYF